MKTILVSMLLAMFISSEAQKVHSQAFSSVHRSDLPIQEYFDRYIKLVEDVSLKEAFAQSFDQLDHLDVKKMEQIGDKVYAPSKWKVKDILQHIIDAERILNYRS